MAGTIYAAIGDIHGRLDLLELLYATILNRLQENYPAEITTKIVFLGDYVDRGPYSKQVLDFLIEKASDPSHIILPGNHEELMNDFLVATDEDDLIDAAAVWLKNGGLETLRSYMPADHPIFQKRYQKNELLLAECQQAIPETHKSFLNHILYNQKPYHVDYDEGLFFVHAGVNPAVRLDQHRQSHFFWARDRNFLNGEAWVEGLKTIHGHTISEQPELKDHRIGIDTGAFMSDILTGVIIYDDQITFLQSS